MHSRSPSRPCRQKLVSISSPYSPFDVVNFQLDSIANQRLTSAPASPPSGLKVQSAEGLATPEVPSPLVLKAALSSSAPEVVSRPIPTTDKEREKLLYPGRINLTSERPLPFVCTDAVAQPRQRSRKIPYFVIPRGHCVSDKLPLIHSLSRSTWKCALPSSMGCLHRC